MSSSGSWCKIPAALNMLNMKVWFLLCSSLFVILCWSNHYCLCFPVLSFLPIHVFPLICHSVFSSSIILCVLIHLSSVCWKERVGCFGSYAITGVSVDFAMSEKLQTQTPVHSCVALQLWRKPRVMFDINMNLSRHCLCGKDKLTLRIALP